VTIRSSKNTITRLAATALLGGAAMLAIAAPVAAQTDGDPYAGPTPPEVAPAQAEVAPASPGTAEVAAAPVSNSVSGGLPVTGGDIAGLVALGATAIVAGGALTRVRRRTA
jgi:hypothetical protein